MRRGWRVPGAKVRGASGRGLLGRDSRQRGVLALGLVVALGKPYASAQAGRVILKPELFMFWRELVAALPLASLALRSYSKLCESLLDLQLLVRFGRDSPVKFFGLTALRSTRFCKFLFLFAF